MRRISKRKLLAFLKQRIETADEARQIIYAGLVTRVCDGQFDDEERD